MTLPHTDGKEKFRPQTLANSEERRVNMRLVKRFTAFALCVMTLLCFASCENPGPQDPLTRGEKEKIVSEFKKFDSAPATDLTVVIEGRSSFKGNSSASKTEIYMVINGVGDEAEIYTKANSYLDGEETGYPTEQYFKDGKFYTIQHVSEEHIYGNCEEMTYNEAFEGGEKDTEEVTTSLPLSYKMLSEAKALRKDDGILEISCNSVDEEFKADIETIITDMTGEKLLGETYSHTFSAVFDKDKKIKEITYSVLCNIKTIINGATYTTNNKITVTMKVNEYGKSVTVPVPERLDECVFIG